LLPLAIFMTGGHEGELAPQRPQCRTGKITQLRLAVVANAFFVDEQQMTGSTESEFDLVVGRGLHNLDSDAIPRDRTPSNDMSGSDAERTAMSVADLSIT